MALVSTSRGFTINVDDRGVSYFLGILTDVNNKAYFGRLNNVGRFDAIEVIKDLCRTDFPHNKGTVDNWLVDLVKGEGFNELHADVIGDTLRYIEEGYRRLPLATYSLVNHSSKMGNPTGTSAKNIGLSTDDQNRYARLEAKRESLLTTIRKLESSEKGLLRSWLSHDGGFVDLVQFFIFVLSEGQETG